MATLIQQKPRHSTLPVGQEVIFTVSNAAIVSAFTNVKFTTPNNAGVGMFDFRPIIESFVKADNLAMRGSAYKGTVNTSDTNVPMHLIDRYSGNENSMRYLAIRFKIEYINADGELIIGQDMVDSSLYKLFNGYLKYTDILDLVGTDFGYNLSSFNLNSYSKSFLTNAPSIQYANLEDYGTIPILTLDDNLDFIKLIYKNSNGTTIGNENISKSSANGAFDTYNADIGFELLFFGCFPANLQGSSAGFQSLVSAGTIEGGSIVVQAFNDASAVISKEYTININCPSGKGFEPIRLTWLNQWGTWDYYTFTMKSSKMISTKGSTYQQLAGSWNEATYRIDSFKGGKKAFRVNANEKITMNTDFVNESESEWFEELINSPEVYILEGFRDETATPNTALNQYVTPVRLTTSSYTKKTIANDRLMQYTFEVEKSKTLRTQAV